VNVRKGRLNLGSQQVEICVGGILGVKGVEAEPFPPCTCSRIKGGDDNRSTGHSDIEFSSGCENVSDQ